MALPKAELFNQVCGYETGDVLQSRNWKYGR